MPVHYKGSQEEVQALDAYVKLSRAAESVGAKINAHLREYNLTVSQFGILEALYHLGPRQTGELGNKILKSSGNMTMVVDNLEKRGLVKRQPRKNDRRCVDIHLTKKGETLVEEILPKHIAGVLNTFAVLSGEEQERVAVLCRKLGLQKK